MTKFVTDKINSKKVEQYIDKCYKNWQDANMICRRLCSQLEIKKTKDGERRPNKQESWIDVQARALYQAARMIMKIKRDVTE